MNIARTHRLMIDAIASFGLGLGRFSVLTEAASGLFVLTPLIAALAGCRRVLALTRDSQYGDAASVARETRALAERWGLEGRVEILSARDDPRLGEADIATNLGFVRPIDAALLECLKPTVAIALMWETWEFRPQDLDIEGCWARGIPVLGTDERHRDLRTFAYLGHVALKLLFELEVEVFRASIVIAGSGEFGAEACKTLQAAGAEVEIVGSRELAGERAARLLREADALVILEHTERGELIGRQGVVSADSLVALNPGLVIAHICGGTDQAELQRVGLRFAPGRLAPAGHMSVTTAFVGPRPLIELHTAGLRVGQAMAEATARGLSGIEAEHWALRHCPYAQGFAGRHGSATPGSAG